MARSIEVAETIDRPPAEVWAALERIEDHPQWMADAQSITFDGPSRRGEGTAFVCRTKVGPLALDDRMEITEWRPGVAMSVRHRGTVSGFGTFRLHPQRGATATRVVWSETLHAPRRLGGPLAEAIAVRVLRRVWRANLRRLRAQVERATSQTIASGGRSSTTE